MGRTPPSDDDTAGAPSLVGRRVRHFRVLERIGEGGMGVVYKAQDERLRRVVALKVLRADAVGNPAQRRRLLREARAAASLSHPGIAVVHEVGEDKGLAFIAMEYVEGPTLRTRLSAGALALGDALQVGCSVAAALEAAHLAGIIHRDLKPENVVVRAGGGVKLLDFGLAKLRKPTAVDPSDWQRGDTQSAEISVAGQIAGTPAYMSPEQARGLTLDARSDLFSLGVLLYECLTGQHPFRGRDAPETLAALLSQVPAPLSQLDPAIPPAVAALVARLMAKEPASRPASAREVREALERASAPQPLARPFASLRKVAVLPFRDLSEKQDQEYFCEGMAEEMIAALSRIPGLRVVARASAFRFKEGSQGTDAIGASLSVDTILVGSVRKAGDRLRVTAQLVNVGDGHQLWAERYDRKLEDVFDVQDEIAAQIVDALRLQLASGASTRSRRAANLPAYEAYLRGRHHWFRRYRGGLLAAAGCFMEALELDPKYAPAHVGLADCFNVAGFYGFLEPKDAFGRAQEAASKALALDATLAEAHAAVGWVRLFHDWDWRGAEASLLEALRHDEHSVQASGFYAAYLGYQGRTVESLSWAERTEKLDPYSAWARVFRSLVLRFARRYDEAVAAAEESLRLDPAFLTALAAAGTSHSLAGRHARALEVLEQVVALSERATGHLAMLAWAAGRAGDRPRAEAVQAEIAARSRGEYVLPWSLALPCVGLGDLDGAFAQLERGIAERDPQTAGLRVEPVLDPLRGDPRFPALLARVGLAADPGPTPSRRRTRPRQRA